MQAFYGETGSRTSIFSPALNKCKDYCLLVLVFLCGPLPHQGCQLSVRWREYSEKLDYLV